MLIVSKEAGSKDERWLVICSVDRMDDGMLDVVDRWVHRRQEVQVVSRKSENDV